MQAVEQKLNKNTAVKPEIVFVFPQFEDIIGEFLNSFDYSLGTGYIRAYLAKQDIPSTQYIRFNPRSVREIAQEIISLGASIVGFSCLDISLFICVILARTIKTMKPDITIIFGGPTVTLADKLIMKQNPCVDICCRGEGEETCYQLILKLRNKEDIGDIRGISYRSQGKIIRTPSRLLAREGEKDRELDFIPSPYLSGMIKPLFQPGDKNSEKRHVSLITARGCTHKCTYCTNTAIGRNRIRYHSIDRVIAEIKYIAEKIKPANILIGDDAFTLNVNRAKKICRRIIEESLNYLNFLCLTRIDKFDMELVTLFLQAGIKMVLFGLESASPKVLNIIKKVRDKPAVNGDYEPELRFLDTMKKNIELANRIGLSTGVSIILGLPGETRQEADETLKFVQELNVGQYSHNYLEVIYGTEIYNTYQKYGIKIEPSSFELPYYTDYSYDVFDIKPFNHSTYHQNLEVKDNIISENLLSFFGVQYVQHMGHMLKGENTDINDGSGLSILIDEVIPDELNLVSWFAGFVSFKSNIFIVEDEWDLDSFRNRLKLFGDKNVPLQSYHRLSKKEKESVSPGNTRIVTYSKQNLLNSLMQTRTYHYKEGTDYQCHILPLHRDSGEPFTDAPNETTLKSIDAPEDLTTLLSMGENNTTKLMLTRDEILRYNYLIIDKCRWSSHACSACALARLIIKRNNDVFTCYSGHPVGKVGIHMDELRTKLDELRQEAETRRGCSECQIYDNCARCIFLPSFLSESQYCSVMKESPNIRIAVEIPTLIRELHQQKKNELDNTECLQISWIDKPFCGISTRFSRQLLKMKIADAHCLYHTGNLQFTNLSRTMKDIWENLASGQGSKEEICKRLAQDRNLSYNSVLNAFDMLVKKIESLLGPN
jgi:radical SAM superfamily enzyme YgiQ (UPF0313 family)